MKSEAGGSLRSAEEQAEALRNLESRLRAEHEERIAELAADWKDRLERLRSRHADHVAALKREHQDQMDALAAAHPRQRPAEGAGENVVPLKAVPREGSR